MGVGAPADLIDAIARGVDLFDCVLPTRMGRHGTIFTTDGRLDLRRTLPIDPSGPLDPECDCVACQQYSAGYLHHLARAKEDLGLRLASIHNVRFLVRLVQAARQAIVDGSFGATA
jgi:queuine tRNA-ribosyltransferase